MSDLSKQNNELLKTMVKSQGSMAGELSDLKNSNSRLLMYFEGDPSIGRVGMYEQQNENTKKINELFTTKKLFIGIGTAVVFMSGVVWTGIKFFFKPK